MRKLILIAGLAAVIGAGCGRQPARQQTPAGGNQPASPTASQPASTPAADHAAADLVEASAPAWREVTIPAGTRVPIRLDQPLASDTSRVEEPVTATVINGIVVRGRTVVPAGSSIHGVVTQARRSGRVKGLAEVAVRFDTLTLKGDDQRYGIRTGLVTRQAPNTHKKDALSIGVPALGGAVIGGILGGRKGAIIGGTVAGGAGTAVVLSTRGEEVRLPRGTHIAVKLLTPVTVRVPA